MYVFFLRAETVFPGDTVIDVNNSARIQSNQYQLIQAFGYQLVCIVNDYEPLGVCHSLKTEWGENITEHGLQTTRLPNMAPRGWR